MRGVSWTKVDHSAVLRELRAFAERHGRDRNVLAVVLFGSVATGDHLPSSDADLLIVLRRSRERFLDRPLRFMELGLTLPVEPHVYTWAELQSAASEDHPFLRSIRRGARLLYLSAEAPEGLARLFDGAG